MTTRILLSTTSYQDTPGSHHDLLESQGWDIVRVRGPHNEEQMLEIAGEFDGFLCGDDAITPKKPEPGHSNPILGQVLPRFEHLDSREEGLRGGRFGLSGFKLSW